MASSLFAGKKDGKLTGCGNISSMPDDTTTDVVGSKPISVAVGALSILKWVKRRIAKVVESPTVSNCAESQCSFNVSRGKVHHCS